MNVMNTASIDPSLARVCQLLLTSFQPLSVFTRRSEIPTARFWPLAPAFLEPFIGTAIGYAMEMSRSLKTVVWILFIALVYYIALHVGLVCWLIYQHWNDQPDDETLEPWRRPQHDRFIWNLWVGTIFLLPFSR